MVMGFPWSWKKGKKSSTRISQMVKDQFHHRKNAATPLVVETGFPTSLVDLIVNHRDRFKKPSPSPRFNKKKPASPPPPPVETDDPPFAHPSQSPLPPLDAHEIDDAGISGGDHGTISGEGGQGQGQGQGQINGAYSNKVLVAVLKIFLLLVLALGAKKFAVGITMSAFFLFFLDYLARNVLRYEHLVPCPEVREKLRLIISRVVRLEEEEEEESLEQPPGSSEFEEIQIVEPIEKFPYRKEETDDPSYCAKNSRPEGIKSMAELIEEEDEDICELPESKTGKSRRAKIKSKMKKLFPKKIANSRKTGKDSKLEIYPERGLEPDSLAMNITPEVKDASLELPEGVVETSEITKSDFVEGDKNYGYLFLIMVALVGLVMGGRIYALLLTFTCCFISKLGGAIMRSSWNFVRLMSTASTAPVVFGGYVLGYVMYDDLTHYYLHHGQPAIRVPKILKKYHLIHHVHIRHHFLGVG